MTVTRPLVPPDALRSARLGARQTHSDPPPDESANVKYLSIGRDVLLQYSVSVSHPGSESGANRSFVLGLHGSLRESLAG